MSKPTTINIIQTDVRLDREEPYAEIINSSNLLKIKHTTIQIRVGRVGHNFMCHVALPEGLSICSVNSTALIVKEWGMK